MLKCLKSGSTGAQWAVPGKKQTGTVEDILPPGTFRFFNLPLEIPDKTKLHG